MCPEPFHYWLVFGKPSPDHQPPDVLQEIESLKREVDTLKAQLAAQQAQLAAQQAQLAAQQAQLAAQPRAASPTPRYKIWLGSMTIFNGVSHDKDTDHGSLAVKGPKGTYGPVFWNFEGKRNSQPDLNVAISDILVPNDDDATLNVSWNAVNDGHGNTSKFLKELGDTAAQAAQTSGNPTAMLVGTIGQFATDFAFADCDTILFSDSMTIDGAALYNLAGHNGWEQEGPNQWRQVFTYWPSSCDHGHYNIVVHIQRTNG